MIFYFPNIFLQFPYHYQYYYISSKTTLKLNIPLSRVDLVLLLNIKEYLKPGKKTKIVCKQNTLNSYDIIYDYYFLASYGISFRVNCIFYSILSPPITFKCLTPWIIKTHDWPPILEICYTLFCCSAWQNLVLKDQFTYLLYVLEIEINWYFNNKLCHT